MLWEELEHHIWEDAYELVEGGWEREKAGGSGSASHWRVESRDDVIRPQGRGGNSGSTFGIGKWGTAIMKEGKLEVFAMSRWMVMRTWSKVNDQEQSKEGWIWAIFWMQKQKTAARRWEKRLACPNQNRRTKGKRTTGELSSQFSSNTPSFSIIQDSFLSHK